MSPPPDDWQQAAARHRDEQFTRQVQKLGKQARRGNRMVGGCLMALGTLALLLGILAAFLAVTHDSDWSDDVYLVAGGGFTAVIGWGIWRGRER